MKKIYLETTIFSGFMKDIAIEEIREVRHRISAECGHDLERFFAYMLEEQQKYQEQIQHGRELLERSRAVESKYPEKADDAAILRDKSKS